MEEKTTQEEILDSLGNIEKHSQDTRKYTKDIRFILIILAIGIGLFMMGL